jgi:hypothetical protein
MKEGARVTRPASCWRVRRDMATPAALVPPDAPPLIIVIMARFATGL